MIKLPTKIGMARSLVRSNPEGNRRHHATLYDLYDSDNWEQPGWDRSSAKCWKNYRGNQWRPNKDAAVYGSLRTLIALNMLGEYSDQIFDRPDF